VFVVKEVKIFILFEVVLVLLKLLAGFVCHSYSMLASCLIEVVLIISLLPVLKYKDNNKFKGLLSSVWGFIILCLGLGMIFYIVISKIQKVSWFILLFIFLSLLARYTVGCFYTNANYRKKKGILGFCSVSSNTDFYITGIIFITFIFTKLSKLVELFKYFDKIGAIAISIFTIYIGMKIIKNSFNYLEEDSLILDEYISYHLSLGYEFSLLDF
jgi:divalent metal cation (Fe/Co/Zn/Cd) transporter